MFIKALYDLSPCIEKPVPKMVAGTFLTSAIAISIALGILATMHFLPSYIGTAAWGAEGAALVTLALYGIKSFCRTEIRAVKADGIKKVGAEEFLERKILSQEFAALGTELLEAPLFLRENFGGRHGPLLTDSPKVFRQKLKKLVSWINERKIKMPRSCPEFVILKRALKNSETDYSERGTQEPLQHKYSRVFEKLGAAYAKHIYRQQEELVQAIINQHHDSLLGGSEEEKEKENPARSSKTPYSMDRDKDWIYLSGFAPKGEEREAVLEKAEIGLRSPPEYTLVALDDLMKFLDTHPDLKAAAVGIKINRHPDQEASNPTIFIELNDKEAAESLRKKLESWAESLQKPV